MVVDWNYPVFTHTSTSVHFKNKLKSIIVTKLNRKTWMILLRILTKLF